MINHGFLEFGAQRSQEVQCPERTRAARPGIGQVVDRYRDVSGRTLRRNQLVSGRPCRRDAALDKGSHSAAAHEASAPGCCDFCPFRRARSKRCPFGLRPTASSGRSKRSRAVQHPEACHSTSYDSAVTKRNARYEAFAARIAALRKRMNGLRATRPSPEIYRREAIAMITELQVLLDELKKPADTSTRYRALRKEARAMFFALDGPRVHAAARAAARERQKRTALVSRGPKSLPYKRIDAGNKLDGAGRARTDDRRNTGTSVRALSGGLPTHGKRH